MSLVYNIIFVDNKDATQCKSKTSERQVKQSKQNENPHIYISSSIKHVNIISPIRKIKTNISAIDKYISAFESKQKFSN